MRRRRRGLPVYSRLTWAWGLSATAIALVAGFFLFMDDGRAPERIALAVRGVERLAPPPPLAPPARLDDGFVEITRPMERTDGLTLAATPPLRDGEKTGVIVIRPGRNGVEVSDTMVFQDRAAPTRNVGDTAQAFDNLDGFDEETFGADDVVITIDGKDASAVRPVNASLASLANVAIPAPAPALLKTTALGAVPQISASGQKASRFYAKPYEAPRDAAQVAIIVGGLGLNPAVTQRAIDDLPASVSLSFAPYARDLEFWTEKARDDGHEVLIELPMENHGGDPGALGAAALLTSRTPEENLQRLDWLMARFGGYFAATNYMGAKFSADAPSMTPVLARLRERGVAYIDDTGNAGRAGAQSGVDWTGVDRLIAADNATRTDIREELAHLETIAARNGAAIGKTYAYGGAIDEIAAWTAGLHKKDLAAAPASAVLQARGAVQ
ncbi:MAG: divergent polysaccharide deacetylase family protein [Pseudomonadota bacterium]